MGKGIVKYTVNGFTRFVREDLKGKGNELSLCGSCPAHKPGELDNCYLAKFVERNQIQMAMTTPIVECAMYKGEVAQVLKEGEKITPEALKTQKDDEKPKEEVTTKVEKPTVEKTKEKVTPEAPKAEAVKPEAEKTPKKEEKPAEVAPTVAPKPEAKKDEKPEDVKPEDTKPEDVKPAEEAKPEEKKE